MNEATLVVTQADREAAERFGSAWRMNAAGKFGLANLLAGHRIAATSEAATRIEELSQALEDAREQIVELWHDSTSSDPLHYHLGMTEAEYSAWANPVAASLLNNPPERGK